MQLWSGWGRPDSHTQPVTCGVQHLLQAQAHPRRRHGAHHVPAENRSTVHAMRLRALSKTCGHQSAHGIAMAWAAPTHAHGRAGPVLRWGVDLMRLVLAMLVPALPQQSVIGC